jgi:hypothetical protein
MITVTICKEPAFMAHMSPVSHPAPRSLSRSPPMPRRRSCSCLAIGACSSQPDMPTSQRARRALESHLLLFTRVDLVLTIMKFETHIEASGTSLFRGPSNPTEPQVFSGMNVFYQEANATSNTTLLSRGGGNVLVYNPAFCPRLSRHISWL